MADLSIFADTADVRTFAPGEYCFREGETGQEMFVILAGTADIMLRGKTLDTLGPGSLFGEMAVIDHRARSADVVARSEIRVAPIDQERFIYLITHHPFFAIEVMKVMADRLRRLDALL